MRRVGQRTGTGGRPALGVVMKELTVGLVAEGRIPCGAKDEAVPRLVHGVGRHADDLAVAQCARGCHGHVLNMGGGSVVTSINNPGGSAPAPDTFTTVYVDVSCPNHPD